MHCPVRKPHHKELVGAAADVTQLDVPGAARQRIPTEVVFVRVGRLQVGRHLELGVARARSQVCIRERVEKRRRLDLDFEKPWRIPADLLKCLVVDIAELKSVRATYDAGTWELPRETELWRKRRAVAIEVDLGKVVHLAGTGNWLVAETEVNSKIGADFPDVTREVLLLPPAKMPVPFANADTVTAGNTQTKVGDGVAAEIGAEVIIASVARRFTAVILIPNPVRTRGEGVIIDGAAVKGGVAKEIQAAIDWNGCVRPKALVGSPDDDLRSHCVGLRNQQRMDAIETRGEVDERVGIEEVVPGQTRIVRLGVGVGILAGHEFERLDLLIGEGVPQEQAVARAQILVQVDRGGVGVDGLRRVGVEHSGIDVDAVERKFRVGVDPSLDQPVGGGIGGKRNALRGERHQHIAVHAAPKFLSRAIQREMRAAPQAKTRDQPVVVFVSGLHAAGLEERSRAEDTVAVSEGNPAIEVSGARGWAEVHRSGRLVAELRTEVTEFRLEDAGDGSTAAEAGIEFLEGVVVDQIELDILVAAAFARLYFGFTNEIQFGALVIGGCLRRGRLGRDFGRPQLFGRAHLLALASDRWREDANSQQESKEPNSHSLLLTDFEAQKHPFLQKPIFKADMRASQWVPRRQ